MVIYEIDEALRSLIRREAIGPDIEVVFDAPTRQWAARRNAPTVDVYLYDIREDLSRRERGLVNDYDGGGRVIGRRMPPRYFRFSYLITAWTQRPEDEHRLLSSMLAGFLRHDAIPPDLLDPARPHPALPLPITIGLPQQEDRAISEVWSALGGELKPSLDLMVSAPTDTGQVQVAGPPVTEPTRLVVGGLDGSPGPERRRRRAAPPP